MIDKVTPVAVPANTCIGDCVPLWSPPAQILMLAIDEEDLVEDLISTFRQDTQVRLERIRAAVERGEAAKVRYEAHSIRGSAQQMGAMELSEYCQELESHAISSPVSILEKAVDTVDLSFQRAFGGMCLYLEDITGK